MKMELIHFSRSYSWTITKIPEHFIENKNNNTDRGREKRAMLSREQFSLEFPEFSSRLIYHRLGTTEARHPQALTGVNTKMTSVNPLSSRGQRWDTAMPFQASVTENCARPSKCWAGSLYICSQCASIREFQKAPRRKPALHLDQAGMSLSVSTVLTKMCGKVQFLRFTNSDVALPTGQCKCSPFTAI